MLALQLACNGIVTGCALGLVAVSFSFVYATTKIFHVAHAGIYTMGGYIAWSLVQRDVPALLALLVAVAACNRGR
jgi:branched-chain amino acid transport system permease protein